jgi:hypothetical protein
MLGAGVGAVVLDTPLSSALGHYADPRWSTPEEATEAFANVLGRFPNERWLCGDGGWTVRHPYTGNVLHVFGDSATYDRFGKRWMPHGAALLQTTAGLLWLSSTESLIPDSPDGTIDWPGPMVWDNERLYLFTSHVRPFDGGWEDHGKDLAEFTWNGGSSLVYRGKWVTPSSGRPDRIQLPDDTWKYNIHWGAAVVKQGSYIYVYGTYREEGWFGHRVYLARVLTGKLHNVSRWWYWNGAGWSHNKESQAKPVISEFGGTESSFSVGYDSRKFKVVSKKDGTFGSDVVRWSASTAYGPFGNSVKVAEYPWLETDQTYLAIAHYDMPRFSNGEVALTVSHGKPQFGFGDLWDNPDRHRNTWEGVAP